MEKVVSNIYENVKHSHYSVLNLSQKVCSFYIPWLHGAVVLLGISLLSLPISCTDSLDYRLSSSYITHRCMNLKLEKANDYDKSTMMMIHYHQ